MSIDTPAKTIRILLVEDEPLWQEGIRTLLKTNPRFELTGLAPDYESALAAFRATKPQIVLLDWKIQGEKDGLEVGKALLTQGLRPEQVILISSSPASSIPQHPFLHIPKSSLANELIPLLLSVTSN